MKTYNERREVARRLRELEVCEFDGEFIDCGEVENALGLVSDDGAWYEAEGVTRLADLIEPPRQCPCYDSGRHWCSIHDVPIIDRDALLALADEMEEFGNLPVKHPGVRVLHSDDFSRELGYARRIREACGEVPDAGAQG